MGSYTSENNCSGQWRRESSGHMYNINGLVWRSFWWLTSFCGTYVSLRMSLCNASTYCMFTFWLSCVNYALCGAFPLLHRLLQDIFTYALFWLPRVYLSLKKQLPYYTISFSWNKRLLEPKFLCDEYVPLTISSPPLHSLLTRRKRKLSFKKVKLVYLKSLQSIILLDFLERTVRKLQSFEWEKKDQKPKAKWARKSS